MFIWDFVADTVLGQIIDWLYGQIVGFLGDFFMQMGSMGAELFEMSWVQSVVLVSGTGLEALAGAYGKTDWKDG